MINSMTGFGRCEAADEERKFTVEMKGVNHRYLDANIRMPKKLNFSPLFAQSVCIHRNDLFTFFVVQVSCTCQARVEGMDYLNDFKWFFWYFYMRIDHGIFIGTMFSFSCARASIPSRRNDTLIVFRTTILDMNPVA